MGIEIEKKKNPFNEFLTSSSNHLSTTASFDLILRHPENRFHIDIFLTLWRPTRLPVGNLTR